jgi:hypothetical protein
MGKASSVRDDRRVLRFHPTDKPLMRAVIPQRFNLPVEEPAVEE